MQQTLPDGGKATVVTKSTQILNRVIEWAKRNEDVRAAILEGSYAGRDKTDEFSDCDVALFLTDQEKCAADIAWLSEIGEVWLCEKNTKMTGQVSPVYYRLTVFADGTRVDFSMYSTQMLERIITTDPPPGPNWYTLGYRVLIDKDGQTTGMAAPFSRPMEYERPTEEEFHFNIEDFWHEAHNVAKYLARGDLWSVKFRDWESKRFLLQMIEWHAHSRHGWQYDTSVRGKWMSRWVDPEIWESLHGSFARFDAEDSWNALLNTVGLFRRIAPETATRLGYQYLEDVDRNMAGLILDMMRDSVDALDGNGS